MRIRNVKPEFYRSDDIDALTWEQRFLFIALFTYVDDNGVGRDRESDICADLFAGDFSVEPGETLGRVRQCLLALVRRGLVVRYEAEGKRFLFITGWDDHQYVKNPNRERYPRPDKALLQSSVDPGETRSSQSVDVPLDLPPVVGSRSLVVGSGLKDLATGEDCIEPPLLMEAPKLSATNQAAAMASDFEAFWKTYPNSAKRADSFRAYEKARKKVDTATLQAGAEEALVAWGLPQHRPFAPAACVWLNGSRWIETAEQMNPKLLNVAQPRTHGSLQLAPAPKLEGAPWLEN